MAKKKVKKAVVKIEWWAVVAEAKENGEKRAIFYDIADWTLYCRTINKEQAEKLARVIVTTHILNEDNADSLEVIVAAKKIDNPPPGLYRSECTAEFATNYMRVTL